MKIARKKTSHQQAFRRLQTRRLHRKTSMLLSVMAVVFVSTTFAYAYTQSTDQTSDITETTITTQNLSSSGDTTPMTTDKTVSTTGEASTAKTGESTEQNQTGPAPTGVSPTAATKSGAIVGPKPYTFAASPFYARPSSPAGQQATTWASSRPNDAAIMSRLSTVPAALWFGDWTQNITADSNTFVSQAAAAKKTPVLVAYNIPLRDCGQYSAGGATSGAAYLSWIQGLANGIGQRDALVILEPDAIAGIECLSPTDQTARYGYIAEAVRILRSTTNASVYIDAGNAGWVPAATIADRLKKSNISEASGFALNVSNFLSTSLSTSYGNAVAAQVNGKHYVVDTSRNGNGGVNGDWCNPAGRALGQIPTRNTGVALADAFLWIKAPGESDGTCNGGPAAGVWWADYALDLAKAAGW